MKLLDADELIMTRLFGPELPEEFLPETEAFKSVDFEGGDSEPAVSVLIQSFIHQGSGGFFPIGWSFQRIDGRCVLSVHRVKSEALAA